MEKIRCDWCLKDDIYMTYHDEVWGVPEKDAIRLFEFLNLEGAQAGLSWYSVLIRMESYRKAFLDWNPVALAVMSDDYKEDLMSNKGIIRNKLKIESVVNNARCYIRMKKGGIDFSEFLWSFVGGSPIINSYDTVSQLPASTETSEKLSKALKKEGFKFVGPIIVYAFMQAAGMVDDHINDSWKKLK